MNVNVRWWTLLLFLALGALFVGCSGGSSQEEFDNNLMNQEEDYNENEEYNNEDYENEESDESSDDEENVDQNDQNFEDNNFNNEDENFDNQNFDFNENNEEVLNEDNNLGFEENNFDFNEEVQQDAVEPVMPSLEPAAQEVVMAEGAPVTRGAAGMASAPGLPELGSKMPYVVQKGDTLSKIAKDIYGSYKKWRDIADLTDMENPNLIYPGEVVYFQLTAESLSFAAKQIQAEEELQFAVLVQPGDSLSKIAMNHYGSGTKWTQVWQENSQISSPDQLDVGSVVYLKKSGRQFAHKKVTKQHLTRSLI